MRPLINARIIGYAPDNYIDHREYFGLKLLAYSNLCNFFSQKRKVHFIFYITSSRIEIYFLLLLVQHLQNNYFFGRIKLEKFLVRTFRISNIRKKVSYANVKNKRD